MSTLLKITGSDGERKRNANDFYPTPSYATEALMNREFFSQKIWEPACGNGAICKVLEERGHTTVSTDLIDYGFGAITNGFTFLYIAFDLLVNELNTSPK